MKNIIKTRYELHDASVSCMNELEFMKDEQLFLEHLLSSHFLELSAEELYDTTRKLIKKLKEVEHLGAELIEEVKFSLAQTPASDLNPGEIHPNDNIAQGACRRHDLACSDGL